MLEFIVINLTIVQSKKADSCKLDNHEENGYSTEFFDALYFLLNMQTDQPTAYTKLQNIAMLLIYTQKLDIQFLSR